MIPNTRFIAVTLTIAAVSLGALAGRSIAADGHNDAIKQFMKTYHKAPKGVDPVCKKATDGKATPAELHHLVAGYKMMAAAKPPKGDETSWKEKTGSLLAATQALETGAPAAAVNYKAAVNCKACHSAHKPD